MTPEEKRQGAFQELDELLAEGVQVDAAVRRAAEGNELSPDIFRRIAEHNLGDLEEYSRKRQLRALSEAIATEVSQAASRRHPTNIFLDGFDEDEVARKVEDRIGRPLTESEFPRILEEYKAFRRNRLQELIRGDA